MTMKQWKKPAALLGGLLMAIVLFGVTAIHPAVTSAQTDKPATSAKTLEAMIKELGVPYKAVGDGKFVVAFSVDDTATTNMVLGETSLTGDDKLKVITIACKVMDGTKDKKPSPAFMQKLMSYDYQTDIGRVGLDSDNTAWYQSSLWKDTATTETLTYDMLFAHYNRLKVAKALQAISEEG